MKIKTVAILGAGAVGSYVIWGLAGYDDRTNIENIHVTNSKFEQVSKSPVSVKGAKDVNFENLFINGQLVTK